MSLKDCNIQDRIKERLIAAVRCNNISHAYIFEGDRSSDKADLAVNFIKAILCKELSGDSCETCISCNKINHGNYEDLLFIEAEGNSIKDEVIEDLQARIRIKPYSGDRNLVIIKDADTMTLRAQNRLLKTLEEPSEGTVIILLSENIENLTQTILSRCVIYRIHSNQAVSHERTLAGAISVADSLLMKKAFYVICDQMSEFISSKDLAYEFLDTLEVWLRDLAVIEFEQSDKIIKNVDKIGDIEKRRNKYHKASIHHAINCIEDARLDLNRNLNIGYTLKGMTLKIIS